MTQPVAPAPNEIWPILQRMVKMIDNKFWKFNATHLVALWRYDVPKEI